ncbi:MAG TPA: zinc-dependent metalloprotease, partial [Chitinophagales bacterium]|nr:zinc-dependent metalloprotease [Chitinophagales bacterium]
TLGLNHNFIASQLHSYDKMQDTTIGKTIGLTASVMDYTIANIAADKSRQGLYFDIKPGPYDKWAIQYGYVQGKDSADEQALLKKILAQSNKKEHRFMNDADDMRAPGRGIDPRANLYDMSDDAIGYAVTNIKMANDIMPKLLEKYSKSGQSYHELRNAYLILTGSYSRSLNVITRYIGGVYVNRSFAGQDASTPPFTPVPLTEQKRAMQMLATYAFSKNAFQVPEKIYSYLQMQRRGYDFRKEPEDPKIHERFLNIQRGIFDQVLHPNVLQRLTDSKLYGNQYELNTMMGDLTNALFQEDLSGNVSTLRQNAQVEYVQRLLKIVESKGTYSYTSQSAAFGELQRILAWMKVPGAGNSATKSHRALLAFTINKFIESK